ncbi:MAG: hypothetical protein ABI716_01755 [Candidatus Saccharibacteria bacterium]
MQPDSQNQPNSASFPTVPPQPPIAPTPVVAQTAPSPAPLVSPSQPIDRNGYQKAVRRAGTTALVLGILMIPVGVLLGLFFDMTAFLNVVLGIVYIIYGVKLRSSQISVAQIISAARIIEIAVIINSAFALIGGNKSGLLPLLLFYFTSEAVTQLFKAGLITTASILNTKPI